MASGATVAQIIPLALTPVITRLYSAEEMGIFALYTSFVVVFLGALSMGFGYALVSAPDEDVVGLTTLTIRCIATLTVPVSLLAFLMIKLDLLGFGNLSPWAVISIMLSLVVTELFMVFRYVVLRHGNYGTLTTATVHQSIARIVGQILLGLMGGGWWGLTLGDSLGRVSGISRLWRSVEFQLRDLGNCWNWNVLRPVVSKYRDFAKYSAPGAIIDSLSSQIVAPLLAAQYGIAVAGQYGIISRLVILPVTLIGSSVADVFHQRLSESTRSNPQSVMKLFLAVASILFVLGVCIAATILWLSHDVWTIVLGDQWVDAGLYAEAIAPRAAVLMIVSPLSRLVLVFGGQKSKLWFNIFNVGIVVVAMEVAKYLEWGAVDAVRAISVAQASAGMVYFVLLWLITRRGQRKLQSSHMN